MTKILIPVHLSSLKEWIRWRPRLENIPFDGIEWQMDALSTPITIEEINQFVCKMRHDYPLKKIVVSTRQMNKAFRIKADFVSVPYDGQAKLPKHTMLNLEVSSIEEMRRSFQQVSSNHPDVVRFITRANSMDELMQYMMECRNMPGSISLEDRGRGRSVVQRLAPIFQLSYVTAALCHCSLSEQNEMTSDELVNLWKEENL